MKPIRPDHLMLAALLGGLAMAIALMFVPNP
jgi:hypothetical protein